MSIDTSSPEWQTHLQEAEREAKRQSTPPGRQPLTDQGIHRSPQDLIDLELTAAGWTSAAAHTHSDVWIAPDGKFYPVALALEMVRQGVKCSPLDALSRVAAEEAAKHSINKKVGGD
jgi:hypothetical protein